ncbi:hypothetical protein [Maricaulis sp.]|uniref:hypothetical protein n=1 Tax=Maricaulis sp. TaxID=1486257 RepID=UPI003A94A0F8
MNSDIENFCEHVLKLIEFERDSECFEQDLRKFDLSVNEMVSQLRSAPSDTVAWTKLISNNIWEYLYHFDMGRYDGDGRRHMIELAERDLKRMLEQNS